jgi:hypothetical protein
MPPNPDEVKMFGFGLGVESARRTGSDVVPTLTLLENGKHDKRSARC